ncbi:MAG: S8 family serine peptidase [Thermoleophilaceae bacterium]
MGCDQLFGSVNPAGNSTVAILDTGVDSMHEDLAGRVVPGTSILDPFADGTSDPNGHGTEMAGIVAASADNGIGIAEVGYAGVSVMPVTVLNANGTGQDSDIKGAVNGRAGYSFMISAVDGDLLGSSQTDKFRIKVWDTASGTIVYDTGASARSMPSLSAEAIAGGSIVIHAK